MGTISEQDILAKCEGDDMNKNNFYLSVHKAGLEGVDKDKVHEVITNASKGSNYYNQEEEKLNDVKKKVEMYMAKVERTK